MTNTMPVLTDEQRQELIDEIDYNRKNCFLSSKTELLMQIAMAALTAPPLGRVNRGEVSDINDYPYARVECLHEQAGWENFQDGYLLYEAPPVTDLKLPDVNEGDPGESINLRTRHDFSNGFRFAIEEVKRLNGVTE